MKEVKKDIDIIYIHMNMILDECSQNHVPVTFNNVIDKWQLDCAVCKFLLDLYQCVWFEQASKKEKLRL